MRPDLQDAENFDFTAINNEMPPFQTRKSRVIDEGVC